NLRIAMQQAETQVVELTTNLDDTTGELIGAACEALRATPGVLDVWTAPIAMKKDRPGTMLSLLCEGQTVDAIARKLITLTGTFGVRHRTWDRITLDRRHQTVETDLGPIRVKIGALDGEVLVAKPEFEDVRAAAEARDMPLRIAMASTQAAAAALLTRKGGDA
ncbi:MAG: nickel insertion protein, partial [Phycisphaeraceae bacterium]